MKIADSMSLWKRQLLSPVRLSHSPLVRNLRVSNQRCLFQKLSAKSFCVKGDPKGHSAIMCASANLGTRIGTTVSVKVNRDLTFL